MSRYTELIFARSYIARPVVHDATHIGLADVTNWHRFRETELEERTGLKGTQSLMLISAWCGEVDLWRLTLKMKYKLHNTCRLNRNIFLGMRVVYLGFKFIQMQMPVSAIFRRLE